ncbi:MAG: hypothetical protein JNL43_15845 [Flavobacteriales bacterium]|nr:hypothetical protein [Flavobacteriales bacterium]
MKHLSALLILLTVLPWAAHAQSGELDPDFATDGRFVLDIPGSNTYLGPVIVQPDDRILVLGNSEVPGISNSGLLVRLMPDGTLDPLFGEGGVASTAEWDEGDGQFWAMDLLSDGSILVAMSGGPGGGGKLVKYLGDGTLDAGFGIGGVVQLANGSIRCLSIASNGAIYAAGYSLSGLSMVARFLADGTPDDTYANSGFNAVDLTDGNQSVSCMDVFSDGSVLVGGSITGPAPDFVSDCYVLRFDPEGALDPDFHDAGIHIFSMAPDDGEGVNLVKFLADGRTVIAGYAHQPNFVTETFVLRGSFTDEPDPTWGGDGSVVVGHGSGGVYIAPDGSCMHGTFTYSGLDVGIVVQKYLTSGTPDASFGSNGLSLIPIPAPYISAIVSPKVVQPNGMLLLSGTFYGPETEPGVNPQYGMVMRLINDFNTGMADAPMDLRAVVYPNPTTERAEFTFELEKEERLTAEIHDAQGKLVRTLFAGRLCPAGPYRETVDLGGLCDSHYNLLLSNGAGRTSFQLTKASARP